MKTKGGSREGAGRPKKNKKDKANYISKTIKFKEAEEELLNFIEGYEGKNFSDKLKNIIKCMVEKK